MVLADAPAAREAHQNRSAVPHPPEALSPDPLLRETGDAARLAECALDRSRHERMLDLTGGDSAALTEIATAQDVLDAQEEPDLLTMTRLAIYRSELNDRNFLIPARLPEAWTRLGHYARAEALAWSLPDPVQQARALITVVRAVAATGDIARAETTARTIHNPRWRAEALTELVVSMIEAGDITQAENLATEVEKLARISHPPRQPEVVIAVLKAVAAAGDVARAETLANTIADPRWRAQALTELVAMMATGGDVGHTETLARTIADPHWQAQALISICKAAAAAGDATRARRIAVDVQTVTGAVRYSRERAAVWTGLSAAVAATGDLGRAEAQC